MHSVLDLFRIGIGPSSSHTVGPMRAAFRFVEGLAASGLVHETKRITAELQGSLALTGTGHGTPRAIMLGLAGLEPETIDPAEANKYVDAINRSGTLSIAGEYEVQFDPRVDIDFRCEVIPAFHSNCMVLRAHDACGRPVLEETYYSTGGGFITSDAEISSGGERRLEADACKSPYPFSSSRELLELCARHSLPISGIVLANECGYRGLEETERRLEHVLIAMMACIDRGLATEGILPGGLNVSRRAAGLWRKLSEAPQSNEIEQIFDRLNVYALAVNEENAAGGQVVTAPTNGAAGIIPSVLRHYCQDPSARNAAREFLLTAGAIGLLYKQRASISGAEMGCQGEVGVACSMAAGGLAAVWGGTPSQVAAAAEIGMEHNLGLTCDPVGGLVQIPCIERNAIGAVKAVNSARLALHGDGNTKVGLDEVIETMRQTGVDMSRKYKETSLGGLAVNVVEC